jgi:hypothetical protein
VNIRKTVVKVKSYTFSTAIITFAAGDGLSMEVVHKLELEKFNSMYIYKLTLSFFSGVTDEKKNRESSVLEALCRGREASCLPPPGSVPPSFRLGWSFFPPWCEPVEASCSQPLRLWILFPLALAGGGCWFS